MGTKYSTVTVSGYNSSPPSDDGSATEANKVKWSTVKTKLNDPVKTAVESINTALVTALDQSAVLKTANYSTTAAEHGKTIEIGSAASSGITISLGDAATMAAGYVVTVSNQSAFSQTIGRVTSGDTINESATDVAIPAKSSLTFLVNAGLDGYVIVARSDLKATFSANKNATDQTSVTSGTKVTFGTEDWDIGSAFASSTWTPPAGKYRISAGLFISAGLSDQGQYALNLYKNGAAHRFLGVATASGTSAIQLCGSVIVDANGTDTFEIYYTGTSTVTISGTTSQTWFCGEQI